MIPSEHPQTSSNIETQMTQSYTIDKVLRKNIVADIIMQAVRPTASLSILSFVGQAIKEKREKLDRGESKTPSGHTDFLTHYIQLQKDNPNIPAWAPTAWTFSNVIAGSDSVGTVMRTIMFNLLVYPRTLEKLQEELKAANVSRPFPRYSEVRDLPYLDACVQEAFRVHPPFALPLERVVPKGGITLFGHHLPEGTVIGGSPYVVNRDQNTFGEDAEFWRPERWLEGDISHRRKLEGSILTVSTMSSLSFCDMYADDRHSLEPDDGYVWDDMWEFWRSRSSFPSWFKHTMQVLIT